MDAFLKLIRLPAVFSAPADVLGAIALGLSLGGTTQWDFAFLIGAASVLLYAAGMICNDLFDFEIDGQERPQRPLPSGQISRRTAWVVALFLQAVGIVLAGTISELSAFFAILLCGLTYGYNGVTKNNFWGPLNMGLCRACNFVMGVSVIEFTKFDPLFLITAGFICAFVALVTRVSQDEMGPVTNASRRAVYAMRGVTLCLPLWILILPKIEVTHVIFLCIPFLWMNVSGVKWRSIPPNLQIEVVRGLKGIVVIYFSLSLAVNNYMIAGILMLCFFASKFLGRWFYAT